MRRYIRICTPIIFVGVLIYGLTVAKNFLESASYFAISTIEIIGSDSVLNLQISQQLQDKKGTNLFRLSLSEVKKEIESIPRVKMATVSRALPDELSVRYEPEIPVALLHYGKLYFVNAEGNIFDIAEASDRRDFPIIQVTGRSGSINRIPEEKISHALRFLKTIKNSKVISQEDIGDLILDVEPEKTAHYLTFTVRYPPRFLREKEERFEYLIVQLHQNDMMSQIGRLEKVLRYLVRIKQKPKQIRLALGKKVVVKIAQ